MDGASVAADNRIPVDVNKEYTYSFDAMSENGGGKIYGAIFCYDIDNNSIDADKVLFIPGSTTTLAQDLKAGDTYVYLTSAAGFDRGASGTNINGTYSRKLIF